MGGQPHTSAASTPGKEPVPIVQEAGWTQGRSGQDSIPDRPARSQSLHQLSYPAHDALFILSLFRQTTSTCFGHICSPSSGSILHIYNKYQLLYIYSLFNLKVDR